MKKIKKSFHLTRREKRKIIGMLFNGILIVMGLAILSWGMASYAQAFDSPLLNDGAANFRWALGIVSISWLAYLYG